MNVPKSKPPKFPYWFLKKFSFLGIREGYIGDIEEEFEERIRQEGKRKAIFWIWFHTAAAVPRAFKSYFLLGASMIKNYLKITFRRMSRQKSYSFLNIAGLSIGMTCCILILLFVRYELSYDKYHETAEDIYRIHSEIPIKRRGTYLNATSPGRLAPALLNDFPEVLKAARIRRYERMVSYHKKLFIEKRFFYADPAFLEIFTFPLIAGDSETALNDPYTLLITETMAGKYFGDENPLGKTLVVNGDDYTITGILKNIPQNSHFTFDFLASMRTVGQNMFRWNSTNYIRTYIRLQKNSDPEKLERKLPEFLKKYMGEDAFWTFHLQPVTRIHLHGNINHEWEANSHIRYVYILSTTAFLILLIASFNYMNLSTARAANRSKEISIRKVVGAARKQIRSQFIGESMFFAFMALLIATLLVKILLPWFNSAVDRNLDFGLFGGDMKRLLELLALTMLVGLISGSYPALFLSALHPVHIIKGNQILKNKSALRNALVVFQFGISIVFIISTIIIYKQLVYVKNSNLGFDKEHILNVDITNPDLQHSYEPLLNELNQNPYIIGTSFSSDLPNGIQSHTGNMQWEGMTDEETSSFYEAWVDANFLELYDMELTAGRNFSREFSTDAEQVYIINETAVKTIGWENPIGKKFGPKMNGRVIGVVKDFHHQSFHLSIQPIVFRLLGPRRNHLRDQLSIKINTDNIQRTLSYIKNEIEKHAQPFSFSFFDDRIDKMYAPENKLERLFHTFSLLAVFIACLGLFGLATFTAERRTKEMGIRKVLGASVSNIIVQLSKMFIKWVLIANLIAWPLAYFVMSRWLQNFAYRIELRLENFILSTAIALFSALITISYQTIRAATANPVDSLKYE